MYDTLENHILHLLHKDNTPRKLVRLQEELGIDQTLKPAFDQALASLCAQGRVILGSDQKARLPSVFNEVTGIFKIHGRGHGFITPEQSELVEDVFVSAKAVHGAMSGDRVVAKVVRKHNQNGEDRLTGKIIKILARAHTTVVGMLRQQDGQCQWRVYPDGSDFFQPVEVAGMDTRVARDGDKVAVEIRAYATGSRPAWGVLTQRLGRPGLHEAEMCAIIRRYQLPEAFGPSVLVEASNAKMAFDPEKTEDREDLTDTLVITIDPPDAQDFDDAVSLSRDEQGRWLLGVHIADVGYFVKPGSVLDQSARRRGNSVYLPGRCLPMLPDMLSNQVCSLLPAQRRYTKSVFLTYHKDGELLHARVANTVIQSKARLTYQQADQALKEKPTDLSPDIIHLLRDMAELARCIEQRRRRDGMLQLKMPNTEVSLDDTGRIIGVTPEDDSYPHTLIEMFMVEANVAIARLLNRYSIPIIRRVHPEPDRDALRRLSETLRLMGISFPRRPNRLDFQKLLTQINNASMAISVNLMVLRSLERALYAPTNVGHYGLAAKKYCHFTSPIRRYADLTVHWALQDYLTGHINRARRRYTIPDLVQIGEHISQTEQTAEEATQELKTILILHLLADRIGTVEDGVIVGLNAFGAVVHLPDYGVQGLLRLEALGPDQWQFNEQSQCLIGRYTGTVVHIGQCLRIGINAVYPSAGQLNVVPATNLVKTLSKETNKQSARFRSSQKRRPNRKKR